MMKRRTKKHFVKFAQTKNEKSMTALMERGSHTQVWCNSLRMSLTKGCRHRTKFPISVRTCQSTQKIYLKFRLDRSQNKDYEQTSEQEYCTSHLGYLEEVLLPLITRWKMRRQQRYHEPKCGSGFATLKEISMTVEKLHLNYSIACLTKKWKKLNPSLAKKSFLKGLMKQQQKFLTISSRAILLKSF